MATNETKRLSPVILQTDKDALAALKQITGYTPSDKNCTLDKLAAKAAAAASALEVETQKQGELDAARDNACAAEWEFHNAILAAKLQVRAQFGDNSNEVQALGLKKKSERARPVRKPAAKPA